MVVEAAGAEVAEAPVARTEAQAEWEAQAEREAPVA